MVVPLTRKENTGGETGVMEGKLFFIMLTLGERWRKRAHIRPSKTILVTDMVTYEP